MVNGFAITNFFLTEVANLPALTISIAEILASWGNTWTMNGECSNPGPFLYTTKSAPNFNPGRGIYPFQGIRSAAGWLFAGADFAGSTHGHRYIRYRQRNERWSGSRRCRHIHEHHTVIHYILRVADRSRTLILKLNFD